MPTVPAIASLTASNELETFATAKVAEVLCYALGDPDYVPPPSVGQRQVMLAKIMSNWAADSLALDSLEVLHSDGLAGCEDPTQHNLFSRYNRTLWECSDISAQTDTGRKQ